MDVPHESAPSEKRGTPAKKGGGPAVKRCPYCGAKNKASFEYCVRCSEPLDELAPEGHIAQGRAALSKLFVGAVAGVGVLALLAVVTSLVGRGGPEPPQASGPPPSPAVTPAVPVAPPLPVTDSEVVLEDFNAGLRAFNAQEYDVAARHFEAVVRELPDNPAGFQYLGLSYFHLGDHDDALDALESARSLRPSAFEILDQYVSVAKSAGRPELAVEALRDFTAEHPENRAARLELARLARSVGNSEEAVQESEALAAAAENDPELSYEYGVSLKDAGRYDEAKEYLRKTIELDPEAAVAYHALGVTEMLSGQPSRAIGALETAVQKAPSNGDFRFSLAQAYEKAERVAESLDAYEAYLQHAAPDDPRAKVVRERLEVAKKALAERRRASEGGS